MSRKIIFVAQASGRRSDPLKGAGGRRLAALASLDHAEFLKRFDRVTLDTDLTAARTSADELRERWQDRRALLLGRHVANAFRLVPDDFEWFKPIEVPPGLELAVIPHEFGISSWWNEPANVVAARDYMLRLKLLDGTTRNTGANNGGRRAQFSEEEVAAALVAGRGIHTWAAKALAEETGLSCSSQTIANYIERYPRLAEIGPRQKDQLVDFAEHNVVKSVEAGDMDTSRWLLRSQMANGRGYALQVNGKVHVSGQVDHRHAHLHKTLDGMAAKLTDQELDVLEGIYRKLAESEDSDVTPTSSGSDGADGGGTDLVPSR